MTLEKDEIERRLGGLVDSAAAARTYTTAPLPPPICLEALASMLSDLSSELRELYVDLVGADPWADHPEEIQP